MGRLYSGDSELGNRKVRAYTGKNLVIDFEMDREGFRKIAVSDHVRDAITRVVRERALPYAMAISPYDSKSKGPHYRDSFVIRQGFETVAGLRRAATRLFNTSAHSVEVEWINGAHVLGRTLSYLLQESIIADLERTHTRKFNRKFKPEQHPRGAKGRFIPKRDTSPAQTPEQKARQAEIRRRLTEGRSDQGGD